MGNCKDCDNWESGVCQRITIESPSVRFTVVGHDEICRINDIVICLITPAGFNCGLFKPKGE